MTGATIGFISGLFVGSVFGVMLIALLKVAKDADEKMIDFFEKEDEGPGDESNDQSPTE